MSETKFKSMVKRLKHMGLTNQQAYEKAREVKSMQESPERLKLRHTKGCNQKAREFMSLQAFMQPREGGKVSFSNNNVVKVYQCVVCKQGKIVEPHEEVEEIHDLIIV